MTTIVCNLQSHAVTHYDWKFCSLSGQFAAGELGLAKLQWDTDAGVPIDASFRTPSLDHGSPFKKSLSYAYLTSGMEGVQPLTLQVHIPMRPAPYLYPVSWQMPGVARAQLGRGISENLLGFGVQNIDGGDFEITQMEVLIAASKNRRV